MFMLNYFDDAFSLENKIETLKKEEKREEHMGEKHQEHKGCAHPFPHVP